MSETTATRMRVAAGIATLAVLVAAWLFAASLLWRTQVPADLRLPRLDPHRTFSDALLRRTSRHDGFLRIDFLLASAAQFVVLGWLAAGPALAALGLLLTLVQPLLGPTLHPLRDRQLAAVLAPSGIRVGVENVAAETRVANAKAIGIGPTRRIIFTDTILGGPFGEPELRFVARHELAHHRRDHLWKGVAWFALFAFPCALLLAAAGERRGGLARPEAVPAVLLAAFCIQLLSLPVGGAIARRYEAEADWTALWATHDPAAARGLFVDFARVDLEQPNPPRWSQLLLDDHPTLLQRIEMAEAWSARSR